MADEEVPTAEEQGGNPREGEIFARIVRGVASQLERADSGEPSEDVDQMLRVFADIADAFDQTNGFEFDCDQALPLSYAFTMLEAGMRLMSQQATTSGHFNAAAKMEWAAIQAKGMIAELERRHHAQEGGVITFDAVDDESDPETDEFPGYGSSSPTKH